MRNRVEVISARIVKHPGQRIRRPYQQEFDAYRQPHRLVMFREQLAFHVTLAPMVLRNERKDSQLSRRCANTTLRASPDCRFQLSTRVYGPTKFLQRKIVTVMFTKQIVLLSRIFHSKISHWRKSSIPKRFIRIGLGGPGYLRALGIVF